MDWKEEQNEALKPRVTREERLRYRNEGCRNCRQDAPLRRGINPLFIVVILGVSASYLLLARGPSSQTVTVKKGCTLKWAAVREGGRQGLSMVLQNGSPEVWGVRSIIASAKGGAHTNELNTNIAPGGLAAIFLPLPSVEQKYKITVEPL